MPLPTPTGFPLEWPHGWPRTPSHKRQHSAYQVTFKQARDELLRELQTARAAQQVLSSNIPQTRDGIPLASWREPADPGVALYWHDAKTKSELVIACDEWRSARENMRAVGLAFSALRMLERTGTKTLREKALESFKRLPPPPQVTPWWQTLRFTTKPRSQQDVEARFRALAREHHPDRGGDHDRFAAMTAAYHVGMQETPK